MQKKKARVHTEHDMTMMAEHDLDNMSYAKNDVAILSLRLNVCAIMPATTVQEVTDISVQLSIWFNMSKAYWNHSSPKQFSKI